MTLSPISSSSTGVSPRVGRDQRAGAIAGNAAVDRSGAADVGKCEAATAATTAAEAAVTVEEEVAAELSGLSRSAAGAARVAIIASARGAGGCRD